MSNNGTALMVMLDKNLRPVLILRAVIFLLYFEYCHSQYVQQPNNSTNLYNVLRRRNHDGTMQDRPRKTSSLTELKQISYNTRKEQQYDMLNDRQHASGLYAEEQPLRRGPDDSFTGDSKTSSGGSMVARQGLACDFEKACAWRWDTALADGFRVTDGVELATMNRSHGHMTFPMTDASGDRDGKFLHLQLTPSTTVRALVSPDFEAPYRSSCSLEFWLHQDGMANATFRIIVRNPKHEVVVHEGRGNNNNAWHRYKARIGRISYDFQVVLEVVPEPSFMSPDGTTLAPHFSVDRLALVGCYEEGAWSSACTANATRCTVQGKSICISVSRICDITVDCDNGEDEQQDCDKIPFGGRCDFESGWCGWRNAEPGRAVLRWSRHQGRTPTDGTGPDEDHTHQFTNVSGKYLYVNMNQTGGKFASNAVLNSVVFNAPPRVHGDPSSRYYNSCMIRFFHHQYWISSSSNVVGSIQLFLVELKQKENVTTSLWWNSKNKGKEWSRADITLPNVTTRYFLQFEGRMGLRIFTDVAIDDFSMSPECFGLNIPASELDGYNYYDPRITSPTVHQDFVDKSYYALTTCNAEGPLGPSPLDCENAYKNKTKNLVSVMQEAPFEGMQVWTVPNQGIYTIIAKGAGGGRGSDGFGSSRGASARIVLELFKGEKIYILVGQEGASACHKSVSGRGNSSCPADKPANATTQYRSKTHEIRNTIIQDGGGGGGGASYVFLLNGEGLAIPLAIGAGGGGLGFGRFENDDTQHGHGPDSSRPPTDGEYYDLPTISAGPGGGWSPRGTALSGSLSERGLAAVSGRSLIAGGTGGQPCGGADKSGRYGEGGFGGGGGGCTKGGGGGGYSGGNTSSDSKNGEGGYSYVTLDRGLQELANVTSAANSGPGEVLIIPAIQGCGCDYRCVSLDEFRSEVRCICPQGWAVKTEDGACEVYSEMDGVSIYTLIFFAVVVVLLVIALTLLFLMLYNRYQHQKQVALRHKAILENDMTLNRLQATTDESALTNFNPNYGCEGLLNGTIDVKSLPQVMRESLRLVKALGQGAFGEVYQGLYRHRDGDAVEMPVAVKTLPDMSTGQAESDFLMEAAIMAKFNHPNIVHLIGVCFDKHPRFIVLELLAGGDLKNFLRESRPKPDKPSVLTTKDLMFCVLDIAKGCRFLESRRFIHRDIAARNCLLTSKGPGRVVKIADFGMARDIYRSDYYRKGGKALLPIKWMPPEAFIDALFTTKSDVWSFGVVLWEIFSLGIMPYTGCTNTDVMQLVANGGRLDTPPGCPPAIYSIMCDCWDPTPENRPTFGQLFDRLTICTQDPEIMNAPLPNFMRLPSSGERDNSNSNQRVQDSDESNHIQQGTQQNATSASDYLIPLPGPNGNNTNGQAGDGNDKTPSDVTTPMGYIPQSNSVQPLLQDENQDHSKTTPLAENLMSMDTPQQTPTSTQPPVNISINTTSNGSRLYYSRNSEDQILPRPDNLLRYPQHYAPHNHTIIPTIRQMANQAVPMKSPTSVADVTGVTLNPGELDQVTNRNNSSKSYINLGVGKQDTPNHVTIGNGPGGGYLNNDSEISC